jgi:hypothetical protein
MVWVKCTTSAECKTIRIAASSVMDGCGDHYIAQCQVFFGFYKWFSGTMEFCARRSTWRVRPWHGEWFGVLGGYCRRLGVVMFDWPPILPFNGVPPFLEILLKTYKSFL